MSLHAAVLRVAGDVEGAHEAEEAPETSVEEWSPMRWNAEAANDDVVAFIVERRPNFHSGDSGLAWQPAKVG